MLGIDLGRLRQRLGLLQRRLEGLERGAPASISNTVPHATEAAWRSIESTEIKHSDTASGDRQLEHARNILAAQRDLLKGKRPDIDGLEAISRFLIEDLEWHGGLTSAPTPTDDPALNRARFSLELGRVVAFLALAEERVQSTMTMLVAAALLADAKLLEMIGLADTVAREQSASHGEEAARQIEKIGRFPKNVVQAVARHHARLDGSGTPAIRAVDQTVETRLLAVAAAYLEQRWPKPDSPPVDSRRALREVLIEAESGELDLTITFRLLDVSFYPKGTLVELSGGEWAEVVATQKIVSDLELASLPIVRIFRDSEGRRVNEPIFWNLAQKKGCRVVRTLPASSL
jgi:hypothetical protein